MSEASPDLENAVDELGKIPFIQPKRKVWRVKIHAEELTACGFFPGCLNGWEIIKKILVTKGLPEGYTLERTPFKMSPTKTGLILEFDQ